MRENRHHIGLFFNFFIINIQKHKKTQKKLDFRKKAQKPLKTTKRPKKDKKTIFKKISRILKNFQNIKKIIH